MYERFWFHGRKGGESERVHGIIRLGSSISKLLYAVRNEFPNLGELNRIWIIITLFQLVWHQTEFSLVYPIWYVYLIQIFDEKIKRFSLKYSKVGQTKMRRAGRAEHKLWCLEVCNLRFVCALHIIYFHN